MTKQTLTAEQEYQKWVRGLGSQKVELSYVDGFNPRHYSANVSADYLEQIDDRALNCFFGLNIFQGCLDVLDFGVNEDGGAWAYIGDADYPEYATTFDIEIVGQDDLSSVDRYGNCTELNLLDDSCDGEAIAAPGWVVVLTHAGDTLADPGVFPGDGFDDTVDYLLGSDTYLDDATAYVWGEWINRFVGDNPEWYGNISTSYDSFNRTEGLVTGVFVRASFVDKFKQAVTDMVNG